MVQSDWDPHRQSLSTLCCQTGYSRIVALVYSFWSNWPQKTSQESPSFLPHFLRIPSGLFCGCYYYAPPFPFYYQLWIGCPSIFDWVWWSYSRFNFCLWSAWHTFNCSTAQKKTTQSYAMIMIPIERRMSLFNCFLCFRLIRWEATLVPDLK